MLRLLFKIILLVTILLKKETSFCCLAALETEDGFDGHITFVNFHSEQVTIYWKNHEKDGELHEVGTLDKYQLLIENTSLDHEYVYKYVDGLTEDIKVEHSRELFTFGPNEFLIKCSTTEGDFRATILPDWSPVGAVRFLELVEGGYFDGCALNRVVPNFLVQFGISANYEMRKEFKNLTIHDDEFRDIDFEVGYLSYAGSGEDSRTAEVFIVLPGVSLNQLDAFGENSWETPFGYVDMDDVNNVVTKFYSYGDIPPWGEGPDPQKIYEENGYEYLEKEFPKLSYIKKCEIIDAKFSRPEEEEDSYDSEDEYYGEYDEEHEEYDDYDDALEEEEEANPNDDDYDWDEEEESSSDDSEEEEL